MSKYRLRRRHKVTLSTISVAVLVLVGQHYGWFNKASQTVQTTQPGLYHVVEFVDGDTIVVDMNGKNEKLRFIGVDTPETHDPRKAVQCFGMAAAGFTKQFIGANNVRLEADPLNTNRDRYGRLLRYIYLPNGTLVNAEIIKQGYGFAYTGFPFTKSDEFLNYQKEAREANRGLWSSCQPQQNQYGGFTSNDAP
ncbi:MAG TPA: thermonuclease family protein [Candidatus Saccharimonadales bacterium]|nr:thermonuclease family protein [Candidatus Saccharimonadales bacterium]